MSFSHTTRLVLRLSRLKYWLFYTDKKQILIRFHSDVILVLIIKCFYTLYIDRSSLSHNVKTFHQNPSERTEPSNSSGTTVWYCCSSERCPGGVVGREGSLWWIEKAKWRRGHQVSRDGWVKCLMQNGPFLSLFPGPTFLSSCKTIYFYFILEIIH